MRLRCLRRSKAEPQTSKSSHIATHKSTFQLQCSMQFGAELPGELLVDRIIVARGQKLPEIALANAQRDIAMAARCLAASGTFAFAQPTHNTPCSLQERAEAVSTEAMQMMPINKNVKNRIPLPLFGC